MDPLILGLIIGALGGAFSAMMGWLGGDEPFMTRKFFEGILRGTVAGAVLALIPGSWTVREYAMLFFAAAGIDISVSRTWRSAKNLNKKRKVP